MGAGEEVLLTEESSRTAAFDSLAERSNQGNWPRLLNEDALDSDGGGIRLRPAPLAPPPGPVRSPPSSPPPLRHVDRVSPTRRLAKASSAVRSMESFVNAIESRVASTRSQIAPLSIDESSSMLEDDEVGELTRFVDDETMFPLHRRRSSGPIHKGGPMQDAEQEAHRAIREACRQVTSRGWSSRGTSALLADTQRRLLELSRLSEIELEQPSTSLRAS